MDERPSCCTETCSYGLGRVLNTAAVDVDSCMNLVGSHSDDEQIQTAQLADASRKWLDLGRRGQKDFVG